MDNKPIKVAQIVGKWVGGGVEAVVWNYYSHIDKDKIQFDFICDEDSTNIPYEEIKKNGGRVILVPPYQKIFKYLRELKKIFKENNYKIVHSHINTLSVFPLFIAKCSGIPVRIAHSHSTTNKKETKKNIIKQILRPLNKFFATDYMCCSEDAGKWMFGKKKYNEGNVFIVNNAIDVEKFRFNQENRIKKRNELNISKDTLVIGHIGRFVNSKNHLFLLDVFNEINKKIPNSVLLLVGQGPLTERVKNKVKKLNLTDKVKFLGQRKDINDIYQALDIFVFPSLYEGLGMVIIEAQCSGLTCFVSDNVPKKVKINKNIHFLSLNTSPNEWSEMILKKIVFERKDYSQLIKKNGYDIKTESIILLKKYKELYQKGEYNEKN